MPATSVPDSVVNLVRRRREPLVVQTARATVAAVLAYVAALALTGSSAPLLAPLTALLVVQVTLYATVTSGARRVVSVVAGVLVALGFTELAGLTWWSLGLLILVSLVLGHLLRVDEFVPEVAISGMLVLGVAHAAETAWDRIAETLIGAAVGVLLNLVVPPPVYVQPAGEAIEELAARMSRLLTDIAARPRPELPLTEHWLGEARALDREIAAVDTELSRAEESLRLHPRVRQGELTRLVMRSGLDTLEVCAVVLRTLCRSLTDLARDQGGATPYAGEEAGRLNRLFGHLAHAVDGFGRLVTAQVAANAELAEAELSRSLAAGRREQAAVSELLLSRSTAEPARWELHGALLANVGRLLDELDVERRSHWLAEQFDRHHRVRQAQRSVLHRLRRRTPALRRVRRRS
ncbi:aromatic acid exporter family protein [Kitasatospora sp. NPDC058965]|uniref:FUSC family protein n=1 Tax=Kitasatospora sp. NPDC058965 TaxID=3346682 RepID=UPI0036874674